jgi:hypothetical protein
MSVGSIESFTEGAELFDQEKYRSTISIHTEPNPRAMEAEFQKPLSDRINRIPLRTDGIYAEYVLDDVKVRCPSDAFRQHEIREWEKNKKDAEKTHEGWLWTAIACAAVAIVDGIIMLAGKEQIINSFGTRAAYYINRIAPVLAVGGLACSIISLLYMALANKNIDTAKTQIDKWSADPVKKVGHERNKAHEQGFPYIYSNSLKLGKNPSYTAVFHPKQVEHEYKKHFDRFCDKLLNKSDHASKVSWMENFCYMNPLSKPLMMYGLDRVPEHMEQVVEDYVKLESFLKNIRSSYDDLKSREKSLAKERIDACNKEKNVLLQPAIDLYNVQLKAAKDIRDKAFEKHPLDTDQHHKDAKATYEATKKVLDNDYTARITPITQRYDAKVKELEKDRDERLKKLDDQKAHQLVNNYKAAHELLVQAYQAWTNQKPAQPVNFNPYFAWQAPQAAQPVYYQQPQAPAQPYYQHPQNPAGYYVQPQYPAGYTQQTVTYYAAPQTATN